MSGEAPQSGQSPQKTRFVDACLIVRGLFHEIEKVGISPLPPVRLKETIVAAISHYISPGKKFPIHVAAKPMPRGRVVGILLRYSDRAQIFYSHSLNFCWTRFIICKELAHLLIDTQSRHYTSDPVALATQLITELPQAVDQEMESEVVAGYAAIEILVPWCLRPQFNQLVSSGRSDEAIAEIFKCPTPLISMLRGGYGEVSKAANSFDYLPNV